MRRGRTAASAAADLGVDRVENLLGDRQVGEAGKVAGAMGEVATGPSAPPGRDPRSARCAGAAATDARGRAPR